MDWRPLAFATKDGEYIFDEKLTRGRCWGGPHGGACVEGKFLTSQMGESIWLTCPRCDGTSWLAKESFEDWWRATKEIYLGNDFFLRGWGSLWEELGDPVAAFISATSQIVEGRGGILWSTSTTG